MAEASLQPVSYGDDPNQFFELWPPAATPIGAAVIIHGGFWRARYDLRHANPFCAALATRGIATASLEYRRVGQSGGGWPGTFQDVLAGVRAASEKLGCAPVLIGHSAGGHLALRLSSEPVLLRAVVALAPVANLRMGCKLNLSHGAVAEFLGATPTSAPEIYDQACPSKRPSSVPRLLLHGTQDEDVPIALSRDYVEARSNDPVPPTLIEIPDAAHMDLIDPRSPAGHKVIETVLTLRLL
jgi:acetyl esterase/lipase